MDVETIDSTASSAKCEQREYKEYKHYAEVCKELVTFLNLRSGLIQLSI